jgi:signal transduction histidine kinase
MVAPMVFKGRIEGFLLVFDRLDGGAFTSDDERLLEAFAASAATAVATARSAADEALRRSIRASELERSRWARELHDETLQELAGVRMLLSGARRAQDPERLRGAVDEALELVTGGVANLRALITELRPAALDEFGLGPALESLAERVATQLDLEVELDVDLAYERGDLADRLAPELESVAYRLVQEALTNAGKHAGSSRARVSVREDAHVVTLSVEDEGTGFAPRGDTQGFGLLGMRERVGLVHGELTIRSSPGKGTTIRATLPVRRAGDAGSPAKADPAPVSP